MLTLSFQHGGSEVLKHLHALQHNEQELVSIKSTSVSLMELCKPVWTSCKDEHYSQHHEAKEDLDAAHILLPLLLVLFGYLLCQSHELKTSRTRLTHISKQIISKEAAEDEQGEDLQCQSS